MDKSKFGQTGISKDLNQSKQINNNTQNVGSTMKKPSVMGSTMGSKAIKKQEKSSEEEIMSKEIQSVEIARLAKVFDQLRMASENYNQSSGGGNSQSKDNFNNNNNNNNNNSNNNISSAQIKENTNKDKENKKEHSEGKDYFTSKDVAVILNDLGYTASKAEIEQMIWEVDENLDGKVNSYEFNLMYRRCRHDTTGLEPRNLYNLVQFLMYLKSDTNVNSSSSSNATATNNETSQQKKTITVEDTLELLYVRFGRQSLDYEIEEIFGKEEKNAQGEEKSITLKEYLDKQRKRDFAERKKLEAERKKVKMPDNNDDDIY